ncbi:MAG: hypothetical protein INR68_08885 [Methylobacterium mesophilicum]|nr:hypothetical protein [Methylobacterium mesophilicum]
MTKPLRQWQWAPLKPYNGFTFPERVRGWQLVTWMIDNGWKTKPPTCCISGAAQRVTLHSENYYDWEPHALAQPIHLALHARFRQPERWQAIVRRYAVTGEEWFAKLAMEPVDLAAQLRAQHGGDIADIFARAPIPKGVLVPFEQIFPDEVTAA